MGLDGISIHQVAGELDQLLKDSSIDKIQQPGRYDLLLTFHGKGGPRLLVSANPNQPVCFLGPGRYENPAQAPMFCMLLRKHLTGARLLSVEAPFYERLLRFRFSTRNEIGDSLERTLLVELQNRHSNIILLNEDQVILDALIHVGQSTSRYREVLPARVYVSPPKQEKPLPQDRLAELQTMEPQAFRNILPDKRVDKALLELCLGFSPQLVNEVLYQAAVAGNSPAAALAEKEVEALYYASRNLLTQITADEEGAYLYPEAQKGHGDFHVLALDSLGPRREVVSLNEAIRDVYLAGQAKDRIFQKRKHLQDRVQKELGRKLNLLSAYEGDVEKAKDFETKRKAGELILSQLNSLPEKVPASGEIAVIDYYDPEGKELQVALDPRYSVRQNANRLFRQYTKDKETFAYAEAKIEATNEDVLYLRSLESLLENAMDLADLDEVKREVDQALEAKTKGSSQQAQQKVTKKGRKKEKPKKVHQAAPLPPRQYRSSDGLEILAGRNNYQNDQIRVHRAKPDDLWFHVKNRPGTHVFLRTEGQDIPDRAILEAAETAAWLSRNSTETLGNSQVTLDVDYCPVSHVKKPSGTKPGYVIYENYHTVTVRAKNPDLSLASETESAPD